MQVIIQITSFISEVSSKASIVVVEAGLSLGCFLGNVS